MLLTILIVVLVLAFFGGIAGPNWGWQPGYGYGNQGIGGIGLILLILVILYLTGHRF